MIPPLTSTPPSSSPSTSMGSSSTRMVGILTLTAGGDLASPALLLLLSGLMDGAGVAAAVVRRGGLGGPWPASDALFPCGLGSPAGGVGGAEVVSWELSLAFLCSQDMRKKSFVTNTLERVVA